MELQLFWLIMPSTSYIYFVFLSRLWFIWLFAIVLLALGFYLLVKYLRLFKLKVRNKS